MKAHKQKVNDQQHNHPTIFSISIFESPEEFLAVYLALQSQKEQHKIYAGEYLEGLLHRTKSPPIALTYTKEFTLLKSESQIQLTIIRFISQLSDLSAGKSMQSSLSFIIDNSSFLTELRHNLTHRVMVKGLVIERGKQMILMQLKQKYWKVMFEKVWKTYFIDNEKVEEIFSNIVQLTKQKETEEANLQTQTKQLLQKSKIYRQYRHELQNQQNSKLSSTYLFSQCHSNYEFKSLIKGYILRRVLPELIQQYRDDNEQDNKLQNEQVSTDEVNEYFNLQVLTQNASFSLKTMVLFSTLLEILLSLHKYSQITNFSEGRKLLTQIIVILTKRLSNLNTKNLSLKTNNKAFDPMKILCSAVVMKKLRQIYLLKYIDEYNTVIDQLPQEIVSQIKKYWEQKQIQLGKQLIMSF